MILASVILVAFLQFAQDRPDICQCPPIVSCDTCAGGIGWAMSPGKIVLL